MSIRGEITEANKRRGEQSVRERQVVDEDDFAVRNGARARQAAVARPQTLYEAGPWLARLGVRCGAAAGPAQDP